jgi:hypothetical protein
MNLLKLSEKKPKLLKLNPQQLQANRQMSKRSLPKLKLKKQQLTVSLLKLSQQWKELLKLLIALKLNPSQSLKLSVNHQMLA